MTEQLSIDFSGSTYSKQRDGARLKRQLNAVFEIMLDGQWHSLAELSEKTGAPQASVSARLRQIRSIGNVVERKHVTRGLFLYRLVA